jgi:ribose transport system permease protein
VTSPRPTGSAPVTTPLDAPTASPPPPRTQDDAGPATRNEGALHPSEQAPLGASPPGAPRRGAGTLAGDLLRQYSLLALLIASVVFYATWSKTSGVFPTVPNFQNIAGSQSVLAVLTLGLLIPMVSGNLDLSVGSTAGMASIFSAAAFAHGQVPLPIGILIGVAVGAVVGLVNGFIVTRFQIDPFIVTLGTASVILGIVDWYTKGLAIVQGIPQSLVTFGGSNRFGIPSTMYVLVLVGLAVWYLLEQTPFGRNLHAIGSNKAAARLVGIRVERDTCTAFILSGSFAGLAGVLLLARSGAGNPTVGQSFTLTAIAAAFLGAASFKLGRLNVLGTLVAIFFLAVNITGLTFAGVSNWISEVFTGLSLVLAVAFATVLSRPRKHKAAKDATPA